MGALFALRNSTGTEPEDDDREDRDEDLKQEVVWGQQERRKPQVSCFRNSSYYGALLVSDFHRESISREGLEVTAKADLHPCATRTRKPISGPPKVLRTTLLLVSRALGISPSRSFCGSAPSRILDIRVVGGKVIAIFIMLTLTSYCRRRRLW